MASENQRFAFGDMQVSVVVSGPPYFQNGYVIRDLTSGSQVIVDPGAEATRFMSEAETDDGSVGAILLTHGHPDHITSVADLESQLDIPTRAHADEKTVIEGASAFASGLMGMQLKTPARCDFFDGEPDLEIGGMKIGTRHMPGHTPGGVCYVFDGFAFTGDSLFNQGIGRTDFPGGNVKHLLDSITRVLEDLPPDTVLFSGHGPEWTVAEARAWWQVVAPRI